mgnify:CR=1 FL=1
MRCGLKKPIEKNRRAMWRTYVPGSEKRIRDG